MLVVFGSYVTARTAPRGVDIILIRRDDFDMQACDVIRNDQELSVTRDRVAYFEDLLMKLRVTARPDEFPSVASGYRAEIERMQQEVLDYPVTIS